MSAAIDREGLIRAALERGPDRLNLRDISEELDVTRSNIYNYVRNPAELGRLVLSLQRRAHRADRRSSR